MKKRIEQEIIFLRTIADEINKVKIRLAREEHGNSKTWGELYYIKQSLLETKIAKLKKELAELHKTEEKSKKGWGRSYGYSDNEEKSEVKE